MRNGEGRTPDSPVRAPGLSRRHLLLGFAGLVGSVAVLRSTGYPPAPAGLGTLVRAEVEVLRAAIDAMIVPTPSHDAATEIIRRIDRFVATQRPFMRWQIHGALSVVEQGPLVFARRWSRFSHLTRTERRAVLDALVARGGVSAEAGRGVRDLVMLGHYQRPESWSALGYRGPWVGPAPRPDAYTHFVSDAAPPGFEAAS